jgi:SAM-dependent methyltransferase
VSDDPVLGRMLDRLMINPPYDGIVADGYDAWLPFDGPMGDEELYDELLDGIDGPILELGCGTGRLLLRWLQQGRSVEGVDSAVDMLAKLRRHAADLGVEPTVHVGDFAPLALGRAYAALVCAVGTFTLVGDQARAEAALASYHDHLGPGGLLAISMYVPGREVDSALTWRMRRTGTSVDGTTIVVHEATRGDREQRLLVAYDRVESYDGDGLLGATYLRKHHFRWWPQDEFEELLGSFGFLDIRSIGDEHAWVTVGHRD